MSKHNAKRTDEHDTLTFARPTKDARGTHITELHAGNGVEWKLTTVPLMVPTGKMRPSPTGIVGGPGEPELAPIFVPVWEVIQRVGSRVVIWHVPVELAYVRMVREAVEVRDAEGKLVETRAMKPAEAEAYRAEAYRAEQERRAALVRGDAEVH